MSIRRWLAPLPKTAMVLVLALGSAAITWSSLVYFGEDLAPFVLEKLEQALPHEDLWMLALRAHVIAAALSLPGCLLLVSTFVLKRAPRFHRWLGRAIGTVILFGLVPSGFYLSFFAKGGLPSTLGFVLSGAIVAWAMVQGVRAARARRFALHRRFVWHVLAQLAVAVVSRAMLFALDAAAVDEIVAYLVSLWLPVVGCFGLVEILSSRQRPFLLPWRTHEAPSHVRPLVDQRQPVVRRVVGA
jgi:hypothetical protein